MPFLLIRSIINAGASDRDHPDVADALASDGSRPVVKGVVRVAASALSDHAYSGHGGVAAAPRVDGQSDPECPVATNGDSSALEQTSVFHLGCHGVLVRTLPISSVAGCDIAGC